MEQNQNTHVAPWLDLPDPLAELILELLPLRYYIRFGAVCQKWRSIQRAHRLRYAPDAPPMKFQPPWLIPSVPHQPRTQPQPNCYSPFDPDNESHRLSLPKGHRCLASCNGWMLLLSKNRFNHFSKKPSLLNPVSGFQIPLPSISTHSKSFVGAMSATPFHPDCMLIIINNTRLTRDIFLYSVSTQRNCWTTFPFPDGLLREKFIRSVAYCRGKFYCLSNLLELCVIDPLAPSVHFLEMDRRPPLRWPPIHRPFLVESNGDLLLLISLVSNVKRCEIKAFLVNVADLSRNMWNKVESLGERTVFLDSFCSFTLMASDVGCKQNCIYYTLGGRGTYLERYEFISLRGSRKVFEIFDLETESIIFELPSPYPATEKDHGYPYEPLHWLLPRLDHAIPAAADHAERVLITERPWFKLPGSCFSVSDVPGSTAR